MPFQKGHKTRVGLKHSQETKLKMSLAKKGVQTGKSWNRGLKTPDNVKLKMSLSHKGRKPYKMTEAIKNKIREARKHQKNTNKGQHWKLTQEVKDRMSVAKIRDREKNHLWKGGITPINMIIRSSREYKLWRESIFKRDNYQCIWGGKAHGSKLHADHIKPFAKYPEFRFAIDNGRTLCVECHKTTDTYLKR